MCAWLVFYTLFPFSSLVADTWYFVSRQILDDVAINN